MFGFQRIMADLSLWQSIALTRTGSNSTPVNRVTKLYSTSLYFRPQNSQCAMFGVLLFPTHSTRPITVEHYHIPTNSKRPNVSRISFCTTAFEAPTLHLRFQIAFQPASDPLCTPIRQRARAPSHSFTPARHERNHGQATVLERTLRSAQLTPTPTTQTAARAAKCMLTVSLRADMHANIATLGLVRCLRAVSTSTTSPSRSGAANPGTSVATAVTQITIPFPVPVLAILGWVLEAGVHGRVRRA